MFTNSRRGNKSWNIQSSRYHITMESEIIKYSYTLQQGWLVDNELNVERIQTQKSIYTLLV